MEKILLLLIVVLLITGCASNQQLGMVMTGDTVTSYSKVIDERIEPIYYETIERPSGLLFVGDSRIVESGADGYYRYEIIQLEHNGDITTYENLAETVPATAEIIEVGVKTLESVTQGVYDDAFASALFESINQSRRDVYLTELSWSDELSQAAKTRAKELLITFDHKRPDGRLWDTVSSHVYAENIAYGQKTSEEAQAGFMQSESHRDNILYGDFGTVGTAVIRDVRGMYYYVQLFGY